MSSKQDLPISSSTNSNYTSEYNYMITLINTKPRSSSGDVSFTSTTSSVVYQTAGTAYANQGQEGLLLVLQNALNSYLINSSDFNNKVDNNYSITSHSGNNYSVTVPNLTSLSDGTPLCVKFDAASTGAITINPNSIGAKNVVDYFGNAVTNVRANLIANLRYDLVSGNFILLGKGGGGNATASQLLSGATATVDLGPITGTMINKVGSGTVITPGPTDQVIPQGYYGGVVGDGKVSAISNIKSIQNGSVAIVTPNAVATVTITSVNPNNAVVICSADGGLYPADNMYTAELTNATTITLTRGNGGSYNGNISWQVIEFNNVKSLQRGLSTVNVGTEVLVAISSVNLAKSMIIASLRTTYASGALSYRYRPISAVQIGIIQTVASATSQCAWQVIEFY